MPRLNYPATKKCKTFFAMEKDGQTLKIRRLFLFETIIIDPISLFILNKKKHYKK